MKDWINLQHLQYFKAIVEYGTIAKASQNLLVSPPALSMQLKQLEERFGQLLFERKNKKLLITEFGKKIYEYASQMNELQDDIIEYVNMGIEVEAKKIKIGLNDALPKYLSVILTRTIKNISQETGIILTENNNRILKEKLLTNKIDLAFSNIPIHDQQGDLTCKEFKKEKVSLYGSPKFKSFSKKFPSSLSEAPFILPSLHSDIRHSIDNWFLTKKVKYQNIIEVQDSSVKKLLACEGFGVVPLPDFGAKKYLEDGELIKIGELKDVYERYYWIAKKSKLKELGLIERIVTGIKNNLIS